MTRSDPSNLGWDVRLREVLDKDGEPELFAQPLVDLARGQVVGYEMLSRFCRHDPTSPPPNQWFTAARAIGSSNELEMKVLSRAIDLHATVPPNCFLSLNVSPEFLVTASLDPLIERKQDFTGLVFEITEDSRVSNYSELSSALKVIRDRGGLIAVDDAGSGYASLRHVLELRPHLVKLDRNLITDIDRDDAKRAVVQTLGSLTNKIDAWLLAEGIEHEGELNELLALGVPLGQGYHLGRPAEGWPTLPEEPARVMQSRHENYDGVVGELLENRPSLPPGHDLEAAKRAFALVGQRTCLAVVDKNCRPVGIRYRFDVEAGRDIVYSCLTLSPELELEGAAQRAMLRPHRERFLDLVCYDMEGKYLGMLGLDRVVEALATQDEPRVRMPASQEASPAGVRPL